MAGHQGRAEGNPTIARVTIRAGLAVTKFDTEGFGDDEGLERHLLEIKTDAPHEILEVLPELAEHDSPGVREQAARLARWGAPDSSAAFVAVLLTFDDDEEVVEIATYSLKAFLTTDPADLHPARIIELLTHESLRVRIAAIAVAADAPAPGVFDAPLARAFAVSKSEHERDAILEALARSSSDVARSVFEWQLAHRSASHRVDARGPSLGERAIEGLKHTE